MTRWLCLDNDGNEIEPSDAVKQVPREPVLQDEYVERCSRGHDYDCYCLSRVVRSALCLPGDDPITEERAGD